LTGPSAIGLRTRVTLGFALGALVLSATLAVLTYQLARTYLLRQRERSATQLTYANARLVRDALRTPEPNVPMLLQSLHVPGSAEPLLFRDGTWYTAPSSVRSDDVPQMLRETVVAGEAARQRFRLEGETGLAVAVPLPSVGASFVEVFPLVELRRTLVVLRNSLTTGAIVTTLAGATGGLWASRRILAPVRAVSEAAAAVAAGQLDVRLAEMRDSDLARMATSFNRMTDALQQRMARDVRFASDVSHELRSPLMTLTTALEVVRSGAGSMPERSRTALDLLAAELERFQRLVEDLLEISRLDAGVADLVFEDVHLGELVLRAVDAWGVVDVPVRLDGDAADTTVKADKRRLERVFANLVDNARRHGGGVVSLSVTRNGSSARVSIDDAGPGVDPEERERIFERFARGRAAGRRGTGEGTGLGLALVREHVALHGGRVWVEEREAGGARFVVELPVQSAT
jgi:two-component system sensor histidine kinase MtrB